jgi:hypothetical protein
LCSRFRRPLNAAHIYANATKKKSIEKNKMREKKKKKKKKRVVIWKEPLAAFL